MKEATSLPTTWLRGIRVPVLLFAGLFITVFFSNAQDRSPAPNLFARYFSSPAASNPFGVSSSYIENRGQYGTVLKGYEYMGNIAYGYEGLGMPVLFTSKGVIHLQRKAAKPTYRAKRKMERKGMEESEIEKMVINTDKVVTVEWLNANPNPQLVAEEEQSAYQVYGLLKEKAKTYRKILYRNLYPGIDIEYSFLSVGDRGFEYKLIVQPGADLSKVQMRYGGDVVSVSVDAAGGLVVRSSIDTITQTVPLYLQHDSPDTGTFRINKKTVTFQLPAGIDINKTYTIDPFVSSTSSLTGFNIGKAKDIDFDYNGNVYVSGGGDASFQRLSKFDANGVLLWTFNGTITTPSWQFGGSYGGWVVEKQTGNSYLGQGLAGVGFSVIRLNAAGVYDNYITTANSNFGENWKMIWSCNGGVPQMLIAGGGGSANNELAVLAPPSTTPATTNLSGLTGGHSDISDVVIDQINYDMYTIYSLSVNGNIDNKIFKHAPPYAAPGVWGVASGFSGALREPSNRPYLGSLDNSSNVLAVNSHFLYYWDGVNLRAYDKATGAPIGNRLNISGNGLLNVGGIYADECNNIFVGAIGEIKVYHFDGSNFDDAAATDIPVAGFTGRSVYDMAYDNSHQLLYASGDGFVASYDISAYCPATLYHVKILPDCSNQSAVASVTPAPPAGTTIHYVLYNGPTQVDANGTGIFTGLTNGVLYTVKAYLNQACGGTQAINTFTISNPPSLVITNPAPVCAPISVDLTASAITTGSTPGLLFTYWTDAAATVPLTTPTAVTVPGTYYIQGRPLAGCSTTSPVVISTLPTPVALAGTDETICNGKSTQLHASGGIGYQWTPSTYLDDPTSANPHVIKPNTGTITYHLVVTDANGCRSMADEQVSITVSRPTKLSAGNDTIAAVNQPVQLQATDVNNSGFNSYTWSPATGLNRTDIINPVATLDRDMVYSVKASTPAGCEATAFVRIKVYKGPEIYVPSAFTPNNDGTNDLLRAVTVGLKQLNYLRIYNRWGQLVFQTSNDKVGWDGKVDGKDQGTAVFVWTAEGVDYKGNLLRRKGTVTLIRK